MANAIRSLMEPVGEAHSNLAKMSTPGGESDSRRTSGVRERPGDTGVRTSTTCHRGEDDDLRGLQGRGVQTLQVPDVLVVEKDIDEHRHRSVRIQQLSGQTRVPLPHVGKGFSYVGAAGLQARVPASVNAKNGGQANGVRHVKFLLGAGVKAQGGLGDLVVPDMKATDRQGVHPLHADQHVQPVRLDSQSHVGG